MLVVLRRVYIYASNITYDTALSFLSINHYIQDIYPTPGEQNKEILLVVWSLVGGGGEGGVFSNQTSSRCWSILKVPSWDGINDLLEWH